ncbi:14122_t:CDS:2, partial [Entrophospora sp. SA101]
LAISLLTNIVHIRCGPHAIQLAVKKGLDCIEETLLYRALELNKYGSSYPTHNLVRKLNEGLTQTTIDEIKDAINTILEQSDPEEISESPRKSTLSLFYNTNRIEDTPTR